MISEPLDIRLPHSRLSTNLIYQNFTPPLNQQEYADLKASILKVGALLQPIIVEFIESKNSYDVIDGYHRLQITAEAGFADVPCRQIFTEEQRLEAILANVNRRQLTADQRTELIRRSQAMIAEARKSLIPALQVLHKSGELAKYIGHRNVHYLMGASPATQEAFYARIGIAFSQPTPSNQKEAQLLSELKRLQSALALAEARETHLQSQLSQATEQATALQKQVSTLDDRLTEEASKCSDAEKTRLDKQLATLNMQVKALRDEKTRATQQIKVLEGQVKTAEAEMAAAQMAAKDAERRLQQTTQRLGNPQLITASFDSLLKLAATIESMIEHAKPLHAEETKQFQEHLTLARNKFDDIESALLTTKADVVSIHRHVKVKGLNS
jgi:hypothetical protein